jgi:hypothetical protein
MLRSVIARFVIPWKYRARQERERLTALRARDGDDCRRCRRPMRFDLPPGHDWGAKVEPIVTAGGDGHPLDDFCLCHRRCNAEAADNTREVQERVRRKNEAELFAGARKRRKRAA